MRAQRQWIVRVALMVGILLGSGTNLFATGSRENPSDASPFVPFYSDRTAPKDVRYSIHVTGRAGATVIELELDFSTIDYVLVKETSAYVEAAQTELQKATNYWGSSVPAAARAVLDNNTLQEFPLVSSIAFSSTVHATFVPGSTNLGTIPAEYYVRGMKIYPMPITSYGEDSIVRVLLIHRDGSWERIGLKIEFFEGEKALFATAVSLPYYKKALGFQYSLFTGSGEEAAFKSAAIKYVTDTGLSLTENDPCWTAFQGANGLSEYQQTFRSVFARHFSFGKERVTLPGIGKSGNVSYVQSGSESFDLIYGKRRSLYMAVYLRFLYERGKPILSKVLHSEMKLLDSGYTYDWKQYEKIPSGAGQDGERLVEAALRYLTWGVEYQLVEEKFNVTRNEVYKNNRLAIDEWVVKKAPSEPPAAGNSKADAWDLLDSTIAVLNLRLMKSADCPIIERFIPNTGEGLEFQVSVQAQNLLGENLNKNLGPTTEFLFLSPEDPFYDEQPLDTPEASNVYRNRGGGFEIYVQDKNGTYTVVLLEPNLEGTDGLSRYTVSPMSGKLTLKPDFFGAVEGMKAGQLLYTRGGDTYYQFYIRPLSGNIRPGDDLVLRLCLKDDPTVVGAASAERLATYDKKLLWRANLYIDDGATDWNNQNPWDAPLSLNEWNRDVSGNRMTGDRAGKQVISIQPWTKNNTGYMLELNERTTTLSVTNAIAYGWGCADEPFSSFAKLQEQKALLSTRYDAQGGLLPNPIGNAIPWNSSMAPNRNWANYLAETITLIGGVTYHSYRPGYSTERRYGTIGQNNYNANANQYIRETAGLDCSGFVQRAARYTSNPYRLPDLSVTADSWTENNSAIGRKNTNDMKPEAVDYSWLLWTHELRATLEEYPRQGDEVISGPVPVVPGDLMLIYDAGRVTTVHVALVQSVHHQPDGSVRFSDIKVIEATSGFNRQYKVLNMQTLWGYIENNFDFQRAEFGRIEFARLRTE